jgi:hypothetical protein
VPGLRSPHPSQQPALRSVRRVHVQGASPSSRCIACRAYRARMVVVSSGREEVAPL